MTPLFGIPTMCIITQHLELLPIMGLSYLPNYIVNSCKIRIKLPLSLFSPQLLTRFSAPNRLVECRWHCRHKKNICIKQPAVKTKCYTHLKSPCDSATENQNRWRERRKQTQTPQRSPLSVLCTSSALIFANCLLLIFSSFPCLGDEKEHCCSLQWPQKTNLHGPHQQAALPPGFQKVFIPLPPALRAPHRLAAPFYRSQQPSFLCLTLSKSW